MKRSFIALCLVWASWATAAEPLTCAEQPGRRFCGSMNRFQSLLVDCSSSGCHSVWSDQLSVMRDFLDEYFDQFLPGDQVGADLGKLANKTARELCGYRITGDAQWISTLVAQYNQFLKALRGLQEMSGVTPYSCSFSET
jgi:hypothetical protein